MQHRVVGWFLALSVAWLADGVVSLLTRGAAGIPGVSSRVALGAPLYFAWLSVLFGLAAGAAHSLASAQVSALLSGLGFRRRLSDLGLATGLLSAFSVGAYHAAVFASSSFFNHALASLLLICALVVGALLLLGLAGPLLRLVHALTGSRASDIALGGLLWALALAGWGSLLVDNYTGFRQLDRGLWVSALALLGAAPPCLWVARRLFASTAPPNVYAVLACFAMGSVVLCGEWQAYAAHVESENGASGRTLVALRKVTDFDRDGSSAWFGGGDCAPHDSAVHPLAPEIIGDGIDNNCLGGDRKEPVTSPPPEWSGPLEPEGEVQNLVILTIDTVRPDHLPMFGYERETTPHLAEHAERSVLFERTYTGAPLTRLAMSSFFSSQRASAVRWNGAERRAPLPRIARDQPWLPRILQRKGFRTAAFVPRFSQFERRGHGFDYGFSRYDYTAPMTYEGGSMQGFPAKVQVDKAVRWLDRQKSGRFFLWVHLIEPHFQYQRHPSAPDYGDEATDLYDSELWYADSQAGRLLEHLREGGHFEDTAILIAGDHGESFMEHGKQYHGFELYEPGIRTLGMLSAPGLEPGRIAPPVSLLDFTPTLLNLLDVDAGYDELRGQNLLPVIDDPTQARPQVIVELFRLPLQGYEIAVVEDRYKLYYVAASGRVLMFDLEKDPDERKPLHASHPEYGRLLDHLTAVFETARAEHEPEPDARKGGDGTEGEGEKRAAPEQDEEGDAEAEVDADAEHDRAAGGKRPKKPEPKPGARPKTGVFPSPTRPARRPAPPPRKVGPAVHGPPAAQAPAADAAKPTAQSVGAERTSAETSKPAETVPPEKAADSPR